MKLRSAVLLAGVVAVLAWVLSWLAVWCFARLVPASDAPRLGQIGDMFGAGASLFSAVAVAAVAVVLLFDVSERRRDLMAAELALRPFIVPLVENRDFRIGAAHRTVSGSLTLPMTLRIDLQNQSDHPALNVRARSSIQEVGMVMNPKEAALPLSTTVSEPIELELTLTGAAAEHFIRELQRDDKVLVVEAEYSSLNGSLWSSTTSLSVSARAGNVRKTFEELLDETAMVGASVAESALSDDNLALTCRPVPGSWVQRPIPTRTF